VSKPHGFNISLIYINFVSYDQGINDIFKLREEEREAIETGIEDTKNGLQLEDIQLIQEFNLVSIEYSIHGGRLFSGKLRDRCRNILS
jgi:hypothetical protein